MTPPLKLSEIARVVGGRLVGDPEVVITGVRPAPEAGEGELAVVIDRRHAGMAATTRASAVLVAAGLPIPPRDHVVVDHPREALARLLRLFDCAERPPGIDPGARVSSSAILEDDVRVAAGAVIADGARLGRSCTVFENAVIGAGCVVGEGSVVFPNVTLYPRVRVGARVRIHAGTVIGADGFGYFRKATGEQEKIPQIGTVEIGDDVEIGAGCTIDRATIGVTRIGRGTKVDNLVQIGHNCDIGEDCCIIAQVGLSGSVVLGPGAVLAGQVGVADHATIGPGVVVGAKTGVPGDLDRGEWLGIPAIPAAEARRVYPSLRLLPEMRRRLRELERRCAELEERLVAADAPS